MTAPIRGSELLIFEGCAHAPIYEQVEELDAEDLGVLATPRGLGQAKVTLRAALFALPRMTIPSRAVPCPLRLFGRVERHAIARGDGGRVRAPRLVINVGSPVPDELPGQGFALGLSPLPRLSITHIFSGALPLVNLGQFCDLANPHQDSFGNGAHDLTQYCLGPSSGFGG